MTDTIDDVAVLAQDEPAGPELDEQGVAEQLGMWWIGAAAPRALEITEAQWHDRPIRRVCLSCLPMWMEAPTITPW